MKKQFSSPRVWKRRSSLLYPTGSHIPKLSLLPVFLHLYCFQGMQMLVCFFLKRCLSQALLGSGAYVCMSSWKGCDKGNRWTWERFSPFLRRPIFKVFWWGIKLLPNWCVIFPIHPSCCPICSHPGQGHPIFLLHLTAVSSFFPREELSNEWLFLVFSCFQQASTLLNSKKTLYIKALEGKRKMWSDWFYHGINIKTEKGGDETVTSIRTCCLGNQYQLPEERNTLETTTWEARRKLCNHQWRRRQFS